MDKLIHYCHTTISQRDKAYTVYINCLSWEGHASPGIPSDGEIMPGVFDADFDDNLWSVYYTLDKDKVTCEDCLEKMK